MTNMEHELLEDSAGVGGYPRMTCYSCGEATLARQPYMSDLQWEHKRKNFLNTHPNRMKLYEQCKKAWPLLNEYGNSKMETFLEYFGSISAQFGYKGKETGEWILQHPELFPEVGPPIDQPNKTGLTVADLSPPQTWQELGDHTDKFLSDLFDGRRMTDKERYENIYLVGTLIAMVRIMTEKVTPLTGESMDDFLRIAKEETVYQLGWDQSGEENEKTQE